MLIVAAELPLQPPTGAEQWSIPDASSSSFKLGCTLMLQQQQQQPGQQDDGQQLLQCVDSHGWTVGCLQQQQVLDALEAAGYDPAMLQVEMHNQQQRQAMIHKMGGDPVAAAAAVGALHGILQGWQAVVKSLQRSQAVGGGLKGVIVRLVPSGGPG
jgi:hypothetical protein